MPQKISLLIAICKCCEAETVLHVFSNSELATKAGKRLLTEKVSKDEFDPEKESLRIDIFAVIDNEELINSDKFIMLENNEADKIDDEVLSATTIIWFFPLLFNLLILG